jgi:hypothetical protein
MSKIYKGQTKLTFNIETETDLTGVISVELKYKNPAGILGSFPATILDITKGIINFTFSNSTQTTPSGSWTYWVKATYSSGQVIFGEPYILTIHEEGS